MHRLMCTCILTHRMRSLSKEEDGNKQTKQTNTDEHKGAQRSSKSHKRTCDGKYKKSGDVVGSCAWIVARAWIPKRMVE